jgi:hypothetical protein
MFDSDILLLALAAVSVRQCLQREHAGVIYTEQDCRL